MQATNNQLPFRASYHVCIPDDNRKVIKHTGWYIECQNFRDEYGALQLWAADDDSLEDLYFLSRRDCELAIAAFAREGIMTDEQMEKLPGIEVKRIAYSALPW